MRPLTIKEIAGQPSSSGETYGTSPSTFDTMKHEEEITSTCRDPLPNLYDNKEDYFDLVGPLYKASVTGNWETAKSIFDKRRDLVRYGLTGLGTALHIAATTKETRQSLHFVKNLVNMMTTEELELKNGANTAFWLACAHGKLNKAKIMLEKNSSLPEIRGVGLSFPMSIGAIHGRRDIVMWLYNNYGKMDGDHWIDEDRDLILHECVAREVFDIALQILQDYSELALNVSPLLEALAQKPNALKGEKKLITRIIEQTCRFFGMNVEEDTDALKLLKIIWGDATRTMDFYDTQDMLEPSGILFVAAERGNTRFIVEVLHSYPDLITGATNEDGLSVFHIAVMHRNQGIYNLLYEMNEGDCYTLCMTYDKSYNNMLHLVGKSSKEMATKSSGACLLMQRELLWFKDVYNMMPPEMREEKNKDGITPYELFSKETEDLVSKGFKWMKDCKVVAALIVTVAFAAAFTVPGGYRGENGLPFFIHERTLLVFFYCRRHFFVLFVNIIPSVLVHPHISLRSK